MNAMTRSPVLIAIPAGEFQMGSSANDKFANSAERPNVRVQIDAFAIGACAVTVEEFRGFKPEHAPEEPTRLPVVDVSWDDACEFCAWLSKELGAPYRLPSEAEWEYACRAGTDTPFYTGDQLAGADANYYYDESGSRVGLGARVASGSFPPNPWGLYEMHGNVCEWCADAWHPSHQGARGSARSLPGSPMRVIRGGGWDYLPRLLRSSWRDGLPAETRRDNLGFRVACTLQKTP